METTENAVQNSKKKRSQGDKIGRLKYNQQLLKQKARMALGIDEFCS